MTATRNKSLFEWSRSPLKNVRVQAIEEIMCETLWPTRCALCDAPGNILCDACAQELSFLDTWRACPRCGAPYGLTQCDYCNDVFLRRMGRLNLPFDGCASATLFNDRSGQLVRVFKDAGEQRLSTTLAHMMTRSIPSSWVVSALTYIPSTKASYRHRGFDHAALLAHEIAGMLNVPVLDLLERPCTKDQRRFGARQRLANLSNRFKLRRDVSLAQPIEGLLVIDDVFTTGATLCAACDALRLCAQRVYCLTFARV